MSSTVSSSQHGVGIGTEAFELSVEAVPFEFSPSLGLLLSGSGLFGFNYCRKRKQSQKLDLTK